MVFAVPCGVRTRRLTKLSPGASAVLHSVTCTPSGARSGSFGALPPG